MREDYLDGVREDLRVLQRQLVRREIDEATFARRKAELLSLLSTQERSALGAPTAPSGPPHGLAAMIGSPATQLQPSAQVSLAAGDVVLGRWRIEHKLGQGGFGVVYKARDRKLDDEAVALKVLPTSAVQSAQELSRFKREVLLLRRLAHRRIVQVGEYDDDESVAVIAMELVTGSSLANLPSPVPVSLVTTIWRQVLEGLAAAHAQGVVHGDVTPSNVLLSGGSAEELLADPDRDPGVKLVDFGLARAAGTTDRLRLSAAAGTQGYMAPEVQAGQAPGPKSDVWSASAVMYQLLVGVPPGFGSRGPGHYRDDVPEWLDQAMTSSLEAVPVGRPEAREVLEALRAGGAAPIPPAQRSSAPPAPVARTSPPGPEVDLSGLKELAAGDRWYPERPHPDQVTEAERLGVPLAVRHEATGIPLVLIPGGEYWMGASEGDEGAFANEKPRHRVRLASFYMGITLVTQEQWKRIAGANPSEHPGSDNPVENVAWDDVQEWLAQMGSGEFGLRLPNEAEWERAARGGTGSAHWWGSEYRSGMANCNEIAEGGAYLERTCPVGAYAANPYGLYDTAGNVWEWLQDPWHDNYQGAPSDGSAWTSGGSFYSRVLRGGSWYGYPRSLRVSNRGGSGAGLRLYNLGFRCARTVLLNP